MFEFLKKESEPDEHAAQPGAADSAPASSGVSSTPNGAPAGSVAASQSVAAGAEATRLLESSPRGRGRPRKSPQASGGDSAAIQQQSAELKDEMQKALDAAYSPEAWGATLGMPFDGMAVITGRERWELSKDERKTIGITAASCARVTAIQNPRALLWTMLAATMFSAILPRAVADLKEMADKRRAEKRKPAGDA